MVSDVPCSAMDIYQQIDRRGFMSSAAMVGGSSDTGKRELHAQGNPNASTPASCQTPPLAESTRRSPSTAAASGTATVRVSEVFQHAESAGGGPQGRGVGSAEDGILNATTFALLERSLTTLHLPASSARRTTRAFWPSFWRRILPWHACTTPDCPGIPATTSPKHRCKARARCSPSNRNPAPFHPSTSSVGCD